jgi:hypothetical protein
MSERTDCEIEGVILAVRLLARILVDNGMIDRDALTTNGERWIDIIKVRADKSNFHNALVALVFAHTLEFKSAAPDTPGPRFEIIKGGKSE